MGRNSYGWYLLPRTGSGTVDSPLACRGRGDASGSMGYRVIRSAACEGEGVAIDDRDFFVR